MEVFRRIVFVASIAGLIAGGLTTVAHHFGTAVIIAQAEVYERAADTAAAATPAKTTSDADHAMPGVARPMPDMEHGTAPGRDWEPEDGLQRTTFTALADIVTAIAFALLLTAGFELSGAQTGWRKGLFWGLAGFATFTIAPTLGLPPELPGTAGAPLAARQIWWIGTAASTGAGLALVFLQPRAIGALIGMALLFAPHLMGAPQPAEFKQVAPEALVHRFVLASTLTNLLLWTLLGTLTGLLYHRITQSARGKVVLSAANVRP